MEHASAHKEAHASPARSQSTQTHLEIDSLAVCSLLECHVISAEDLELIEMRYRQALAITALEEVFAEGQLNCA
jgi:hypothetical protein